MARFRLVANGGTGEYTYYRDIEQIRGPTTSKTFVYELQYGADAAAVGTFIVLSGDERAEDSFWVRHPDCSDY